jgi:integrase
MAKKKKNSAGVFVVEGKLKTSYGIDYVHPQTGQRVRKILKNCPSEAAAIEIRAVEIADAARGALNKAYGLKPKAAAVSFVGMVNEYLNLWSKQNKNYRTDKQRASMLEKFFAVKLMSDITPWVVEKFKAAVVKEKARSTVNKYLSLGSQVFEKAIEWKKFTGENPFLVAGRFKNQKGKKLGCLSPEDVEAIMSEIGHQAKRDAVEFGFNTGWRVREILGLKWSEVNLETGSAWIMNPKNGDPAEIELNERAVEILAAQARRGEFVFCMKNGAPFKTGLHAGFKAAAIRAGVVLPKRKAWHMLRRTWASMFLRAGGDVETLRVLGNWKDYSMPMHYADAAGAEHKRKILNQFPRLNGRKLPEMEKATKLKH